MKRRVRSSGATPFQTRFRCSKSKDDVVEKCRERREYGVYPYVNPQPYDHRGVRGEREGGRGGEGGGKGRRGRGEGEGGEGGGKGREGRRGRGEGRRGRRGRGEGRRGRKGRGGEGGGRGGERKWVESPFFLTAGHEGYQDYSFKYKSEPKTFVL